MPVIRLKPATFARLAANKLEGENPDQTINRILKALEKTDEVRLD